MTDGTLPDHGFIGDKDTHALIGRDGTFGPAQLGGERIDREGAPLLTLSVSDMLFSEQRYVSETNVLETSLDSGTGSILVLDLVPPGVPGGCFLRVIRGITGAVSAELQVALPTASPGQIRLLSEVTMDARSGEDETQSAAAFEVNEGDALAFALVPGDGGPRSLDSLSWRDALRDAAKDGRSIASGVSYQGPWRADVVRSELFLHALRDARPGWCGEALSPPVGAPDLARATNANEVRALQRAVADGPFVVTGAAGERVAHVAASFWLVDALLAIGELDEALTYFDAVRGTANHLGLFAEATVPESGEQRGCFPHPPSHRAFVATATRLTEALRARDG